MIPEDDWGEPITQGAVARNRRKRKLRMGSTVFLILNVLFCAIGVLDADLSRVALNGIATLLLFVVVVFLPGNAFALYQNGFELSRSLYQEKIKKRPGFVPIKDIVAIAPNYTRMGDRTLRIRNFRFHYSREEFFTLTWPNLGHLEEIKKVLDDQWAQFGGWDSLYKDDFDMENFSWDSAREAFLARRKVMFHGAYAGLVIVGAILGLLALGGVLSVLSEQPFQSGILLLMSFNMGMKWSVYKLKAAEENLIPVLKFIHWSSVKQ